MGDISVYLQLAVVLAMIFVGARIGGIGLGITGMVGMVILVFGFGLKPGTAPIDVMMIIVSVITASSLLQASGGLDYLVNAAANFLAKHPNRITYYGPLTCWLFCLFAGTAHTSYSLFPIISEIARNNKIRPERPLSVSAIAASLGITGSPVSAATAAIISTDILGGKGVGLFDVLIVCIPASFISILVASFIQDHVGKDLEKDPIYLERLKSGQIKEKSASDRVVMTPKEEKLAKRSVIIFLLGVLSIVVLGAFPQLRPSFADASGASTRLGMSEAIEMIMMTCATVMYFAGHINVKKAVQGSVFSAGMVAVISIFGVAWMGNTFFNGNVEFLTGTISSIISSYPMLFALALFVMSIMLFSQAATVKTLYPLGIALGINPMLMLAMFPACNGYFFLPNYPTEVAAINFDETGTTRIGKYVINHSFQLAGFVTTIVSIGLAYLTVTIFY